jgi:hypothetical protein
MRYPLGIAAFVMMALGHAANHPPLEGIGVVILFAVIAYAVGEASRKD